MSYHVNLDQVCNEVILEEFGSLVWGEQYAHAHNAAGYDGVECGGQRVELPGLYGKKLHFLNGSSYSWDYITDELVVEYANQTNAAYPFSCGPMLVLDQFHQSLDMHAGFVSRQQVFGGIEYVKIGITANDGFDVFCTRYTLELREDLEIVGLVLPDNPIFHIFNIEIE